MSKRTASANPDLDRAIKDMLKGLSASTAFEQRRQTLELAIKYEGLKLKMKGDDTGKFFSDPGADDDDSF